jgi:hypothetical protein
MFRVLVLAAGLVLAGPAWPQADEPANLLMRQAHARWVAAQAMGAGDLARAEAMALVMRDLQAIVKGYPGSTVATLLELGESIGGVSLAAVEAALAGVPTDALCEAAECRLSRLDAAIARHGASVTLMTWRAGLLGELGRFDEAAAGWTEEQGDRLWNAVVNGAARAGREDVVAQALERVAVPDNRAFLITQAAIGLARAGDFDAAHALIGRAGEVVDRATWASLVLIEIEIGSVEAAEARIAMVPASEVEPYAERFTFFRAVRASAVIGALESALATVSAVADANTKRFGYERILRALGDAGRVDEFEAVHARAAELGKDPSLVMLAQALARVGRLDDARKTLMQMDDRVVRDRELERAQSLALIAAGPEAILTATEAAPPTLELFDNLDRVRIVAMSERNVRVAAILFSELLRLSVVIPDFEADKLQGIAYAG